MSAFSEQIDGMTHCMPIRVYYEDTDAGGIVYYANYLKFAERARTEMLRLIGVNQSEMADRYGLVFAVRSCAVEFLRPARFDDLIEVRSQLVKLAAATVSAAQAVWRGTEELARLDLRVACVRQNGRPARIPAAVRQALEPYVQRSTQG
ncbi:MAG: tol-pal system-associated acyl-CoA thioesterase [Alphaproteobacteria bacterium]